MGIPIILGQNIGTCVTAMISAISANKNGKRTAVVHLLFNVIGVVFWLSMYYLVGWILNIAGVFDYFTIANSTPISMFGIAIVHTTFKILAVAAMWPFTKLLEKLAYAIVKGDDKKGDEYTQMLDERLLETPSVAIENARKVVARMAEISIGSLKKSLTLFDNYDEDLAQEIRDEEDKIDVYEDVLGSYLVKLSSKSMSERDSVDTTTLLHIIGDLERISDHSVNIVESAEEIKDKNIAFSIYATNELRTLRDAVDEILDVTLDSYLRSDFDKASLVEPLEQVVDYLRDQIKLRHTIRLQKNLCSIELGFILSDILTNLERVSDHCSNVAGCMIEMSRHETLDIHNYLHGVREEGEEYKARYSEYMDKYALPKEVYGEQE